MERKACCAAVALLMLCSFLAASTGAEAARPAAVAAAGSGSQRSLLADAGACNQLNGAQTCMTNPDCRWCKSVVAGCGCFGAAEVESLEPGMYVCSTPGGGLPEQFWCGTAR
eukprot:jgi/Chlat1/8556/Chrsp82S07950